MNFTVRVSKGVVTIRVGRMVESFTAAGKTPEQIWNEIKWRSISKGVSVDHPQLKLIEKRLKALGK